MPLLIHFYKKNCKKSDQKRDKKLIIPKTVAVEKNLNYYSDKEKNHNFDIFFLNTGAVTYFPTIVSIHGGGYVYGDKDIYQYYCAYLASQGFAVISMNYTLAPKGKFPLQLEEINQMFSWIATHNDRYHLDLSNLFAVGDSAGAQLLSQYAVILTNPSYAQLFDFSLPPIRLQAIGLNCGMYDAKKVIEESTQNPLAKEIGKAYLGKNYHKEDSWKEKMDVLKYINSSFPPSFILTASHDFIKDAAEPMKEFLNSKGVEAEYHLYGKEDEKQYTHVFHVNMNLSEAKEADKEELQFFRKHFTHDFPNIVLDPKEMIKEESEDK